MANETDQETRPADRTMSDRDRIAAKHAAREQSEPAAAPLETDQEAGAPMRPDAGPRGVTASPAPYDDMLNTEVRAGPGDAGASDRPRTLARTPETDRERRSSTPLWYAGILALLVIALISLFAV